MKNYILTTLIIVLFSIQKGIAQQEVDTQKKTSKYEFGLRSGYSKSYFITEGEGEMKGGYLTGIYGIRKLSDRFALEVDVYYTQLGTISYTSLQGDYTVTIPSLNPFEDDTVLNYNYDLDGENKFKNDYIAIPILARYALGKTGLELLAGVRFGFIVNTDSEWEGDFSFTNEEGADLAPNLAVENILNEAYEEVLFKTFDMSLSYGLSYHYKDFPISIDFRGYYGFNKINKNTTTEHVAAMKNASFELGLLFKVF